MGRSLGRQLHGQALHEGRHCMQLALGPCCLLFCVLEAWQILSGFIAVGLRFKGRGQGWGELVRSRFLNLFAGFAGGRRERAG